MAAHRPPTLLIVYHSTTGGTWQMAEAVARGAMAPPAVDEMQGPLPLASHSAAPARVGPRAEGVDRDSRAEGVVGAEIAAGAPGKAHSPPAPTVHVRLLHAPQAGPQDLLDADAYVFATPENLGAISGLLKDFFDRCYYPVLEHLAGRPCALLVCAGSDGQQAARQMARIATGWRLKPVAEPLIVCTHAQTPEAILAPKTIGPGDLERCRHLGAALALGLEMGVF